MSYKETLEKTNKILIKYFENHKRIYAILQILIGIFLMVFALYCISWLLKLIWNLLTWEKDTVIHVGNHALINNVKNALKQKSLIDIM